MVIKFKHHATDEIIEVEPTKSIDGEGVYCKKLDKTFFVIRKTGDKTYLKGTSYVEVVK